MDTIALETFPAEAVGNADILDSKHRKLLTLFLKYGQGSLFLITNPSDEEKASEKFYNDFGVFFSQESLETFSGIKEYLLMLEKEDIVSPESLDKAVNQAILKTSSMMFSFCAFIFNTVYTTNEQMSMVFTALINRFGPTIKFFNSNSQVGQITESNLQDYSNYNVVPVADIFKKYPSCVTASDNVKAVKSLIRELVGLSKNNTVFTLGKLTLSDGEYEQLLNNYINVAAYMTAKYKSKFIIPVNYRVHFLALLKQFSSLECNYLGNYLKMVKEFPYFSISINDTIGLLHILDITRLMRNPTAYDTNLTVYTTKFNVDKLSCSGSKVQGPLTIPLSKITILDIEKIFGLSVKDNKEGVKNLAKFEEQINLFQKLLKENNTALSDVLLNISNVLLYSIKGETYLAYVGDISGKLPFIVTSLSNDFGNFHKDVDVMSLSNLLDTSIIFDLDRVVNNYKKKFSKFYPDRNRDHFRYNNLEGFLYLYNWKSNRTGVSTDCPLNVSDIGIWHPATKMYRKQYKMFSETLSINKMIEKGILTFYGCTHPYITNFKGNKFNLVVSTDLLI